MAKRRGGYGYFFCGRCGNRLDKSGTCRGCGFDNTYPKGTDGVGAGGIGWSERINDKRFKKYRRNSVLYAFGFAFATAGGISLFLLCSGEITLNGEGKAVIGVLFAMMFVSAFATVKYCGDKWEGTVTGHDASGVVTVTLDNGKKREINCRDNAVKFEYYRDGDRVRRHLGAVSCFEKYDKSREPVLFCSACGTMTDARDDYCPRCGCPILKGKGENSK